MHYEYYDGAVRACWFIYPNPRSVGMSLELPGHKLGASKDFPTEAEAVAYADALIAAKRELGFREGGCGDSITAADPEHVLELGLRPYEDFPPLLALERRPDGSIRAAELSAGEARLTEPIVSEELIMALLRAPSAARMESLYLGIRRYSEWSGSWDISRILQLLPAYGDRPALRRLVVRGDHWVDLDDEDGYSGCYVSVGPIDPVLAALSHLEELEISATQPMLSSLHHDHLQRVVLDMEGLSAATSRAIAGAQLPAAIELELCLGVDGIPGEVDLDLLAGLWIAKGMPRLEALGLQAFADTDALISLLAGSPVLKRLRRLSLANGTLSDEGVECLIAHHAAFAHLERLELTGNRVRRTAVTRMRAALPVVEIEDTERVVERVVSAEVLMGGRIRRIDSIIGSDAYEIAPFVLVEDARDITGANQAPLGPHPICALVAISFCPAGERWCFRTSVSNNEDLSLEAGEIQLTWAGRGMVLDEYTKGDGTHEIVRMILRQPVTDEACQPRRTKSEPWPISPGVVRLFDADDLVESLEAAAYQVTQPTRLRFMSSHTAGFVYARRGSVSIAGTEVPEGHFGILSATGDTLWLDANGPFEAIVGTGCPLQELAEGLVDDGGVVGADDTVGHLDLYPCSSAR